jgi:hypothetical protein
MRRLKNPNQWPPGGWNFEEPCTGFRFKGSSLEDLSAKVKLHRLQASILAASANGSFSLSFFEGGIRKMPHW